MLSQSLRTAPYCDVHVCFNITEHFIGIKISSYTYSKHVIVSIALCAPAYCDAPVVQHNKVHM